MTNQPSLYLVVGLGKTGLSIARYLRRRNQSFLVFDTRIHAPGLDDFYREFPDVDVFLETFPETFYEKLQGIITSPGVSLEEPVLKKAAEHGITISGDIECLAGEINVPVIAITGTNGKSTVTTLVGEMAKAAGISVAIAGNIGAPVLDLLDDGFPYDLWVLELSSFQLDLTFSLKPTAATVLNITPDHLDRHHTLAAYIQSKQRVYEGAELLLFNRDDQQTFPDTPHLNPDAIIISYGLDKPSADNWGIVRRQDKAYLAHGEECLLPVDSMLIKGQHNWQNALAACALAKAAGIEYIYMIDVLQRFAGLPHRCQWIASMDGVDWINDSKGTNIGATVSAISGIGGAMQGKIVLIAGGLGKGADFTELRTPIADYVRALVLIGEDADKIEQALIDSVPISRASTLDEAVSLAKSQAMPGDIVLLSPACASMDMFRDFNHRGEEFMKSVDRLL